MATIINWSERGKWRNESFIKASFEYSESKRGKDRAIHHAGRGEALSRIFLSKAYKALHWKNNGNKGEHFLWLDVMNRKVVY